MFAHIPVALGVQLIGWLLGRALGASSRASIWLGCFAGAAVCIMREITQREYQWIEQYGGGLRRNMPFDAGLRFWEWSAHSISETVVAIACAMVLAMLVSRFG
jgi:hypothetical protein